MTKLALLTLVLVLLPSAAMAQDRPPMKSCGDLEANNGPLIGTSLAGMIRLASLLVVLLLAVVASPAAADRVDLETLTVAELQEIMQAGRLSSAELTRAYIERIERLNSRGPGLNAVRILNPQALDEARALDREEH